MHVHKIVAPSSADIAVEINRISVFVGLADWKLKAILIALIASWMGFIHIAISKRYKGRNLLPQVTHT